MSTSKRTEKAQRREHQSWWKEGAEEFVFWFEFLRELRNFAERASPKEIAAKLRRVDPDRLDFAYHSLLRLINTHYGDEQVKRAKTEKLLKVRPSFASAYSEAKKRRALARLARGDLQSEVAADEKVSERTLRNWKNSERQR